MRGVRGTIAIGTLLVALATGSCSADACGDIDRTLGNEQTVPSYADAVVALDAIEIGDRYELGVPHLRSDVVLAEVLYADPRVGATAPLRAGATITVDEFDCAPPAALPAAAPSDRVIALLSAVEAGSDVRAPWWVVYALVEEPGGSLRFLGSDGAALDRRFEDRLGGGVAGFVEWLIDARGR